MGRFTANLAYLGVPHFLGLWFLAVKCVGHSLVYCPHSDLTAHDQSLLFQSKSLLLPRKLYNSYQLVIKLRLLWRNCRN